LYDKNEDPKGNFTKVLKLPKDEKPDQWEHPQLLPGILTSKIKYMAVTDEFIIFTTENNQLMKISISLERPTDDVKYEYLISPFHSRSIQGMDICIKKNLVATCSIDKTVRIWNNSNPPVLEICELFNDEAYSLAFHPSGFHLIVGFTDRVRMMNVFKDSLKPF
jgi:WD40 repeat protein